MAAGLFFERVGVLVVNHHLIMFSLISLGVGVAYSYSIIASFPEAFPPSFLHLVKSLFTLNQAAHHHGYSFATGFNPGLKARSQTSQSIKLCLGGQPNQPGSFVNEEEKEIPT